MACEAAPHPPCCAPARPGADTYAQHNPQGARNVQKRIQAVMDLLLQHPQVGHGTARPGIRRFVASPYPYALTYRATESDIVILGVRHTSRRPLA